uniref:Uncharacterized protein n=1 Tax=Noctiluca scintillans TaxID=2966 RepID=A0A7S1ASF0_NOCSC|mmetsp:Transcript_57745/g.153958  ORF Transcript_57745/g.153958 Transcript_57745/m.153958 type:complete len:185 (+) Transcript_57745:54-608(+)
MTSSDVMDCTPQISDRRRRRSLASELESEHNATPLKHQTPGGRFSTPGRTPDTSGFAELWGDDDTIKPVKSAQTMAASLPRTGTSAGRSEETASLLITRDQGAVEFEFEGKVYRVIDDGAVRSVLAEATMPPRRSVASMARAQRANKKTSTRQCVARDLFADAPEAAVRIAWPGQSIEAELFGS